MDIAIIVILVLGLCALSAVEIYSLHVQKQEILHLQKELKLKEQERLDREQEKQAFENFVPYLICAINEETIYDDAGAEVGKIEPNTFHTIIFEKEGRGQLFSGEGWIDLNNVVRNPVRNMQAPMRAAMRTPLKNGPGVGYKTLGEVMANEVVEVTDIFGVWYRVKLGNNITGYVYYKNLR